MQSRGNRFSERALRLFIKPHVLAVIAPKFAKCRDVGADDTATGEQRFDHGETEALHLRWGDDSFAVSVAPLEFRIGDASHQPHSLAQARTFNRALNTTCLGTAGANDDELHRRLTMPVVDEEFEGSQQEGDVLVVAMLGDAEEKWIRRAIP